jgi:GNAT superfamily N-acetyltransferase
MSGGSMNAVCRVTRCALEVYRNKGIGRALIAGAEDFAVREGARWLRISVLAQNEIPRRLYERCGFGELVIEFEKELPSG